MQFLKLTVTSTEVTHLSSRPKSFSIICKGVYHWIYYLTIHSKRIKLICNDEAHLSIAGTYSLSTLNTAYIKTLLSTSQSIYLKWKIKIMCKQIYRKFFFGNTCFLLIKSNKFTRKKKSFSDEKLLPRNASFCDSGTLTAIQGISGFRFQDKPICKTSLKTVKEDSCINNWHDLFQL